MSNKNYIENLNWELLTKYITNEANDQEKAEIEIWLNQSDENRKEMENCKKMLRNIDGFYKAKNFDSKAAWKDVDIKIHPEKLKIVSRKKRRTERITQFYKYAAIAVIALFLGSMVYYLGFRNQTFWGSEQVVSAEKQLVNEFELPDGSVVTLNSDSKLEFPKQFASNVREVTIIGEAFFDVKPNPEKPFVINAGNTQVKVLGTSFNVSAYPENRTVDVVVTTGKVQVLRKNEDLLAEKSEVFLTPGEKGTFFTESNFLEKSINTDVNYLAWKTNDIIFNETQLNEVIQCLEKVYHIEIELAEPELANKVLTAHFDKKPIDFVLNVVRLTFNLELNEDNEHYTLMSRKN